MNLGEFRKLTAHLPDEMPFQLLDISTDDDHSSNYAITEENISVSDYTEDLDEGEVTGKALYICFENILNPNPLSGEEKN
jgi:hypothetical protein